MAPAPSTLLIHPHYSQDDAPERASAAPPARPVSPVIDRSSTHTLDGPGAEALARGEGLREHDVYGRFGTSTTRMAAQLIARLEGAESALLTSSGMAAITTAMTTLLPAGGRLACAEVVYGGTESVISQELTARGVETLRFDAQQPETLAALLREHSVDLVWCESIANPLLQVSRMAELARTCKAAQVPLAVDATFAGGMAQHPLALGASVVVHSATKFLNGHSDVIAGVIASDAATVDRCFDTLTRSGCCIDPHAAWLLARGLRTLALRWRQQVESATSIAKRLAEHGAVARVYHPSLEPALLAAAPLSSPGAVLAFELADPRPEALDALIDSFRLVTHATSLGGVETLACAPARTTHACVSAEQRRARGIEDTLLRVSVGIEDAEDLWADFQQALARSQR